MLVLASCSTSKDAKRGKASAVKAFEGTVTYKVSTHRPAGLTDREWKEMQAALMGKQGYIMQKNHYKTGLYYAEIDDGIAPRRQMYHPADGLHYAWDQGSDEAFTQDQRKDVSTQIEAIIDIDTTARIQGYDCKAIRVVMDRGYAMIWYSPALIYIPAGTYKGTLFDQKVVDHILTLPVRAEHPGIFTIDLLAVDRQSLADELFELPAFKHVEEMSDY